MNSRLARQFLALLITAGLAVSACGSSAGQPGVNLSADLLTAPAISPLLTGMSAQMLPLYEKWFSGDGTTPDPFQPDANGKISNVTDPATGQTSNMIVVLDPACGLNYAYDLMKSTSSPDGLKISNEFYNSDTGQALFLLEGYAMTTNPALGVLPCSAPARQVGYIPLRLDLISGRWNIEGFASPGATIEIKIGIGNEMVALQNDSQISDNDDSIVAPDRLARFNITDANWARVQHFATLSNSGSLTRQVYWLDTSDVATSYLTMSGEPPLADNPMCLALPAFWSPGVLSDSKSMLKAAGLTNLCPNSWTYYGSDVQNSTPSGEAANPKASDWINATWLQSDGSPLPADTATGSGSDGDNVVNDDGDDTGEVGGIAITTPFGCFGACGNVTGMGNSSDAWALIDSYSALLAATATYVSDGNPLKIDCSNTSNPIKASSGALTQIQADRALAFCAIQTILQETYGGAAYLASTPSADVASWDTLPSNVFGLVADNGADALKREKGYLTTVPSMQSFVGFVGQPNIAGTELEQSQTTITPSLSVVTMQNDDASEAAFYDSHSFLFNPQSNTFNIMSFSTDDPTKVTTSYVSSEVQGQTQAGIPYVQSPLTKVEIDVANPLNVTNTAAYVSSWIPTLAMGRNGPSVGVAVSYNPLTQFGQAVGQAVQGLIYNIYSATVGSWTASLSQGATADLFAMPMLDQYNVAYYIGNTPVYAPSNLVLSSTALAALEAKLQNNLKTGGPPATAEEEAEGVCSMAAKDADFNQLLADYPKAFAPCVQSNPFYTLWSFFESFAILLMVLLIARYFYGLMSFETGQIRPIGFLARVLIAMALTMGMNVIIGLLTRFVAETILITDIIGTNMSNGQPYNHLWLFSTFLQAPAHDFSVLGLFMMAPFVIIGLLFVILSSWLRIGAGLLIVCLSPLWVFSLLTDRQMKTFTSGLTLMMRLYLVPMASLLLLLGLFLIVRMIGIDPTSQNLLNAIIMMLFMIAVAIIPWFLAKYLTGIPVTAIKTAIARTSEMADASGMNAWLEAGGGAHQLGANIYDQMAEDEERKKAQKVGEGEAPEQLAHGQVEPGEPDRGVYDATEDLLAGGAEEPVEGIADLKAGNTSEKGPSGTETPLGPGGLLAALGGGASQKEDAVDDEAAIDSSGADASIEAGKSLLRLGSGTGDSVLALAASESGTEEVPAGSTDDSSFDDGDDPDASKLPPGLLDRFGGGLSERVRNAVNGDFDSVKADFRQATVGPFVGENGLLARGNLLGTLTGTAFIERHSQRDVAAAQKYIADMRNPDLPKRLEWLRRDGAASLRYDQIGQEIEAINDPAKKLYLTPEGKAKLKELESARGDLLKEAQPGSGERKEMDRRQKLIDEAMAAGGAGTNFSRGISTFAGDVAAYRTNKSAVGLSSNAALLRLAAAAGGGVDITRREVARHTSKWGTELAAQRAAADEYQKAAAQLATLRLEAEKGRATRGGVVAEVSRNLGGPSALDGLFAGTVDDPERFSATLSQQQAETQARLAAAQGEYAQELAQLEREMASASVGGQDPRPYMEIQQRALSQTQQEERAAAAAIARLRGALGSSVALPEAAQGRYRAELAAAEASRAQTASRLATISAAITEAAAKRGQYETLEAQKRSRADSFAAATAGDRELAAALRQMGRRDPSAAREEVRARLDAAAQESASRAAQMNEQVEALIGRIAQARISRADPAAENALAQQRALLAAKLDRESAAKLQGAIDEGVRRQAEFLSQQNKTVASYEAAHRARNMPPFFAASQSPALGHFPKSTREAIQGQFEARHQAKVYADRRASADAAARAYAAEAAAAQERATAGDLAAAKIRATAEANRRHAQSIVAAIDDHNRLIAMQADLTRETRVQLRSSIGARIADQEQRVASYAEQQANLEGLLRRAEQDAAGGKVDKEMVWRMRRRTRAHASQAQNELASLEELKKLREQFGRA